MKQHPNFCYSVEEGKSFVRKPNNSRYRYFHQNHFTSGDIEQFLGAWKNLPRKDDNPFKPENKLTIHDIFNTFQYIHDKFKKGCFLQIHEGKLKTFQPFSKQNFRNEWGNRIQIDPKFRGDIMYLMKDLSTYDPSCPTFNEKKIHRDVHSWYGNNGLIRMEYPLSENDNGYNILDDMMTTLVETREIPDFDFFLNKRDFPILRKDRKEAYISFFGMNQPLLSHAYDVYAPIFSMNTSDEHEDVAIPTWEDWRRVSYWHDKKLFGKDYVEYHTPQELEKYAWDEKISTAVWRGSSTGLGTTVKDNIRLFFYQYSLQKKKDVDGNLFLDAAITKWNLRPRKSETSNYVSTIYKNDFVDFSKGNYMSLLEQSQYKYILHLPGHTCAYRLSYELFSGSLILMYPCSNRLWFTDLLQPYVHYVPLPIDFDTDALEKTIRWCKENDETCRQIVKNALEFAHRNLSRDAILDYLQRTFQFLAAKNFVQYSIYDLQTEQIHQGNKLITRYLQSFQMIPIDLYAKNIWIEDNYYITYFFNHLQKQNKLKVFLDASVSKPNYIQSKKTTIHLYENYGKKWIEKISPYENKRDDVNQIFIGYYYINRLAELSPHFTTTLYHRFEKEMSHIYLDYVQGETLEKLIRTEKLQMNDLINIWVQLTLAIEQAQDYCGFMHMDTNPWNIMIRPQSCSVSYPKHSLSVFFDTTAVLIDYGNSHVSHKGFHFYNTIPFYLNSISDIVCMIIGSLDIYLSKITLDSRQTKQLFILMKFISDCFSLPKAFSSIHEIKMFLKANRNFSKMLCNNKILKQKKPFEFIEFLIENNILQKKNYSKTLFQKSSPITCLHYPSAFHSFLVQLSFFKSLVNNCTYNKNDFCILFRRLLIQFKKTLKIMKYESKIQKEYCHYIIHDFIFQYELSKISFEKILERNIWHNHDFKTFLYFLDDYQLCNNLLLNAKEICETNMKNFNRKGTIPSLRSHICLESGDMKGIFPNEYFDSLDTLYLFSPKEDLFSFRNQLKNDFIATKTSFFK
jgi:hypothetical protein